MRALIVDDEPVARRVLREELEATGGVTVVGEAENGTVALERIQTLRPDVMLLDLQMPGLDGFGVIRELSGGPCRSSLWSLLMTSTRSGLSMRARSTTC